MRPSRRIRIKRSSQNKKSAPGWKQTRRFFDALLVPFRTIQPLGYAAAIHLVTREARTEREQFSQVGGRGETWILICMHRWVRTNPLAEKGGACPSAAVLPAS